VRAASADIDALGAYAIERADQRLYVVLINKATAPRDITINVNGTRNGAWQAWRFDAVDNVVTVPGGTMSGSSVTVSNVPGRSATLLLLPTTGGAADTLFANGFE
jgi:hypothetical protein